jgi:zinc protease
VSARVRNRRVLALTVAIALAGVVSSATAQSLDRTQRPAAPPDKPFKFPNVVTTTLPNGLRIAVVENHAVPVVAVRVAMTVDSLADPAGKEGLFSLTQAMLREGTTTHTADQFAAEFTELGDAVTPSGFTLLSSDAERGLALLADMLENPAFPESALERRKAARVAAIKALLQSPYTAPRRLLYAKLFGAEHPLARSIVPAESAIASITREDVQAFHDRYFRPGNTTIVIAGDVSPARVTAAVTRLFGGWKRGKDGAAPAFPAPAAAGPTAVYLIDRPGATQSAVYIGQLGPARTTADFAALETLAPILGAIPGSRLQNNLRERHSFVYASTPFTVSWRRAPAPSMLFGQAAVNAAKTDSAVVEWMRELTLIRGEQPVTEAELGFGRGARVSAMPARIETTDSVATRVAELARDGLPLDFYDRYVSAIRGLTAADVDRAAAAALRPAHWIVVIAGDRKVVEAGLRAAGIGPVTVVDEDGKPVP